MNSLQELSRDIFSRWTRKAKSKSIEKKTLYRTTPLTIEEVESVFDKSKFIVDLKGMDIIINPMITKEMETSFAYSDSCLVLKNFGIIHVVKINKCTEGGTNLLNKLIHLANKYNKGLIIDVDNSHIIFDFGEKVFDGESESVKLQFNYMLSSMYLKSYGMTWYNSLGFVNLTFDDDHAFFVEKYKQDFEKNRMNLRRMRTILNKGKDMSYEEYVFLKELEDDFKFEMNEHYLNITTHLIYDSNRVMNKSGGRRMTKNKRRCKTNKKMKKINKN